MLTTEYECSYFQRNAFQLLHPTHCFIFLVPLRLGAFAAKEDVSKKSGAGERSRTPDLLITNELLYQLSYTSQSCVSGSDYRKTGGLKQPASPYFC